MKNNTGILIYGYGNPGRSDDGLGIAFSEKIEQWISEDNIKNVCVETNYQLNIEDVEAIHNKKMVIFADASNEDINDISFTTINASPSVEYSMHSVSPSFILHLCNNLYNTMPESYLLHIKGYDWQMKEGLTSEAEDNLNKAFLFIKDFLVKNIN